VIALYNVLLGVALVIGAPVAVLLLALVPRWRVGLSQRLCVLPRRAHPTIWVHAASVGEVEAALPLIRELEARGLAVIATALSPTGRARLRELLPHIDVRLAPLDLPGLAQLSVRRARVRVLVLIETELWPNAIAATHSAGGRVVIASGRISDQSFPRYRRLRLLFAPVLRRVARIAAQNDESRQRFCALGARPEHCSVVGDLKLDRDPPPPASEALRAALGEGPFLVGGSTHAGEEEALLDAWRELRARHAPELRLLLVPRHPDRAEAVLRVARSAGDDAALRSKGASRADVVVVDTLGELAALYGLADLVFAGGTLVPVGGHNLIEPVRAGRVVVCGPHLHNQRPQVRLLGPFGALVRIDAGRELAPTLERLWLDPSRNQAAERARAALAEHRGALQRVASQVCEVYDAALAGA
jgi:3-deoxy-D-manno-octulosonic-acid transferase